MKVLKSRDTTVQIVNVHKDIFNEPNVQGEDVDFFYESKIHLS